MCYTGKTSHVMFKEKVYYSLTSNASLHVPHIEVGNLSSLKSKSLHTNFFKSKQQVCDILNL